MMPIFLPHSVLDELEGAAIPALPVMAAKGRERLRALRDRAIAEDAHVLLLAWPTLEWV